VKKIFVFIICVFVCISVFAEPIPFEKAQIIAGNWALNLKTCYNDNVTLLAGESIIRDGMVVAHVFHFYPRGYVIVSAEDYLPPIKMYSLKNNFGEEGESFEEFTFNRYLQIIKKVKSGAIDAKKYFAEKNRMDVKRLTSRFSLLKTMQSPAVTMQEVQPLLRTTWYQREPYNLKCPVVNNERCVTGCVATAFAQIMKYHEYPGRGQGSWSYRTSTHNIEVSASFDHPYYWSLMLDDYPAPDSGTEEQREAVARLMFDVGVSLSMNYGPDGSGASASTAVITFPIFFKYSKNIVSVSKSGRDDAEWFDLAKNHVDQGFPVAFSIYDPDVGHLVAIDGYRISPGSRTFHINMGWGGSWDGYYSLDNIIVRDGKYHFTDVENQSYVLNITSPNSVTELPPLDFGAFAHKNNSLFQKEYFCEIKWQGLPPEAADIDKYDIEKFDIYTLERTGFAEVDHTGQTGLYQYTFRLSEPMPDVYFVYAVTHEGERKLLMCCNLVVKE
jgi:hypothetical protein